MFPTTGWPDEKTWPVLLYRRESDGWKKQELESPSSSTRNNRFHPRVTTVAPRKECIIFPALRQKFSLKSQSDQGTIIRRDDKILLISKRRARAMLLQFQSLEDCLAFSDQFLRFNPKISPKPPPAHEDPKIHNSDLQESPHQQQGREASMPTVNDDEHKKVVSWVVKMLHNKDFLGYVHKIEKYIAETEDGLRILKGLEHRDLSTM
eukprot:jgi/Psemu1/282846/fgenesh1_pg.14_\